MTEAKIYDVIPEGWKRIENATNHPKGFFWISNGKSFFSHDYRQALCKAAEL